MRRQFGADAIKIDTFGGQAWCAFFKPKTLDFPTLKKAVTGAGYTLHGADITTSGIISRPESDGPWVFKTHGTQQVFHLTLDADWKGSEKVRLKGRIVEIQKTPTPITVQEITAES